MAHAIAKALAGRALLLFSLIFAFILAIEASWTGSVMSLYVLIAYGTFGVLPVAYMEIRSKT